MKEIRCKKCGVLLMKGEVKSVQVKCRSCGHLQMIYEKAVIKNIERS